MRDGGYVDVVE